MGTPKMNMDTNLVKKETMYMVSFICLVIGFLCGVVVAVYKSSTQPVMPAQSMPPAARTAEPAQPAGPSADELQQINRLERQAAAEPTNAQVWTDLGNLYFDTRQHDKAIEAYKRALEIKPGDANVLTDMGVMYRRTGQPRKAIEAFEKAMRADPKHEVSRFNKGIVLMHDLNDAQGAVDAWEDLVRVNPQARTPSGALVRDMVAKFKSGMGRQQEPAKQKEE